MAYRAEEGDKYIVQTKEQADHSFQYTVAAACIDGRLMPEQYRPERIISANVQTLLHKVTVRSDPGLTRRYPEECVDENHGEHEKWSQMINRIEGL